MPVTPMCPETPALRRLLLGDLPPADLERLGAHVLHCDRCAAALNGLQADESLLQTLRGGDSAPSPTPAVQVLIARLSRPRAAAGDDTVATAPSPPDEPSVEGMVSRWHALRQQGQEVSAEELCAGRPELLGELRRRLEALARVGGFLGAAGTPTLSTPLPDGPPAAGSVGLRPPEAPGELGRLGGYRVLKQLGQGGMGTVYLAEDPQLERPIALKVMRPDLAARPEARQRFLREARATARLKDDHIVAIYQVSEDRGVPFLAMEYLEGESLESWLRKGRQLSAAQVLRVARDITRGLAAAHAKGLVHRDIKPANLWLEAPQGRIKILDFGLARSGVEEVQLTQSGTILGTPAYMAPEQGRGEPADARSDLFSLGCVLYRLCTGQAPFQGSTVMAVLTSLATHEPAPVRQWNPQIPEALANLVVRLLAKRREDRPASAQAVLQELQAIGRQRAEASQTTVQAPAAEPAAKPSGKGPAEARRPRRRRGVRVAAALLGVAGVIALGIVVIRITGKDGKQTETAVPQGSKVAVNQKGGVDIGLPGAGQKPAAALQGTASPLDKLDPAQIPAAERFDWQPKELVAVLGEHRQRHWGAATDVAVSRDGKRIATTGVDGLVRFWDPVTLRETGAARARPPGTDVRAPAFSPDGKRLVFVNWPGVGFYDLSGAEAVREKTALEAGGDGCCQLAFTPDGKRLIGSDNGGTLYLWDLANGQTKPSWKWRIYRTGSNPSPTPFDLSQDGRTAACFSDARTVTLLDVSGAGPRELLAVPLPAAAGGLALSPDGKRLAVGFLDRKIRFWGVSGKTPEPEGEIDFGPEPGLLRFSPDGKRLAAAYTRIRLWDFERKNWVADLASPGGAYSDLRFTPDGQMLIAASGHGTVHFWTLSGEKPRERNPLERTTYLGNGHPGFLRSFFSRDGKRLATVDLAGFGWWDLDRPAPARLRELTERWPYALSPDGKQLLLAWDLSWCDLTDDGLRESGGSGHQLPGASHFRLLPDGKTVLAGTTNGEVVFAERGAGRKLVERSRFRVGDGAVWNLEVSPDGRMIATCTVSGMAVKLWDLTAGKPALRDGLQEGRQTCHMVFSPDGRLFAVSDTGNNITVWDVQNRPAQQRRRWHGEAALAVAFSPDGRTLASASFLGKLALRDIETGETHREWQLPGPINYVTYAPDGRHLLTINGNGTGYILRLAPPPAAQPRPK